MSSIGSTPQPVPTDPALASPSIGVMGDQILNLMMFDVLRELQRIALETARVDSTLRAKQAQMQLEMMKQKVEAQRRAAEQQFRTVSAMINAQMGAISAAQSAIASGAIAAGQSAIASGAITEAADTATAQAKQYQAVADMTKTMVQEQQQAMAKIQESQQAAVKQVAAMLQQRIEQQRQLFGTMGS
jgi:hypothetical protein